MGILKKWDDAATRRIERTAGNPSPPKDEVAAKRAEKARGKK